MIYPLHQSSFRTCDEATGLDFLLWLTEEAHDRICKNIENAQHTRELSARMFVEKEAGVGLSPPSPHTDGRIWKGKVLK